MTKKIQSSAFYPTVLSVFSFSLFTSAALMFAVQPLAGKMLFPLVGGSPSGWVVAMAFFQIMLLAGYTLAHLLSKLEVRLHGAALTLLLLCGFLVLPVSLSEKWQMMEGIGQPSLKVLTVLALATGLPFVALSVTSPTLQRLFSTTGHPESHDPYFLYAASNIGSFAGLFAYPLLMEPLLGLQNQAQSWQAGYILLIALSAACLLLARKPQKNKAAAISGKETRPGEPTRQRFLWLALSFAPSSLMLGVTAHITTDVVSAPLLWVTPLAIYLLTHVVAFARNSIIPEKFVNYWQPVSVGMVILWGISGLEGKSWLVMLLHLVVFWLCAQMCHMRLADSRPPVSHLTEFYLFLALGGALGGSFNAFLAPFIFKTPVEYPLMLILCCALHPQFGSAIPRKILNLSVPLIILAVAAQSGAIAIGATKIGVLLLLVTTLCVFFTTSHPRLFFYAAMLIFVTWKVSPGRVSVLHTERNFFGVIKITENKLNGEKIRVLRHGTTLHGFQVMTPEPQHEPISYYTESGPIGDIIGFSQPRKTGVIGLGTGTLACYTTPDRDFEFYEIDPAIVSTAREWFSFLKECAPDAPVYIGDGRLELEKNTGKKYDLLILDAFSSDAIPLHLLTAEAFTLYKARLSPGGLIAVHISNRFLDLKQTVAKAGEHIGFHAFVKRHNAPKKSFIQPSEWVLLTPPEASYSSFEKQDWKRLSAKPDFRLWTDDFSNILSAMRL